MGHTRTLRVLFYAAAGPQRGYGHLIRCGALARALDVPREVVLRGSAATVRTARKLGWTVGAGSDARLTSDRPDLIVIDDPSAIHAARWVRRARRHRIPVATVHDLGLARVPSDLQIDGSLAMSSAAVPANLQGPEFSILDPAIPAIRACCIPRDPHRVLITLGGGAHVRAVGVRLANKISSLAPEAEIDLAAGFSEARRQPRLPPRCRWIAAPSGLAEALATAAVVVVAGGVTLHEACALGTPIVALAVTPAQRPATAAVAAAGAAIDASAQNRAQAMDRAAFGVVSLLAHPDRAARLGLQASRLVDGRGAWRVAHHLQALAVWFPLGARRHVA